MDRHGSARQLSRRSMLVVLGLAGVSISASGATASADGIYRTTTAAVPTPLVRSALQTVVDGPQRARLVGEFLDSVGVCVHWSYPDTPYGSAYEQVRALLVDSGIRHVRGEAAQSLDLLRFGIKTNVIIENSTPSSTPAGELAAIQRYISAGAVDAVEGPNEGDLFWVDRDRTYQGHGFPEGVRAWQADLYRAVRANPANASLTVIGPSLGKTYWGTESPFRANEFADLVDWGNFHPYPGGNPFAPTDDYAAIKRYYWNSDSPSLALDRYPINFETYAPPFGDHTMAATETGYSTWVQGQSEVVQGRYVPRLFLENFRLGVVRSYLYELVDEFVDPDGGDREAHFGLLRHDLSPKPAYRALTSLLTSLGSSGSASTAGATSPPTVGLRLDVTPAQGYRAAALHHVLLARPDGTFALLLWHEVSSDDFSALSAGQIRQLDQPTMAVSLTIETPVSKASVAVLQDDGTWAAAAVDRSGRSFGFEVPDRVTLVSIIPA